jgi:competence protein ComEA
MLLARCSALASISWQRIRSGKPPWIPLAAICRRRILYRVTSQVPNGEYAPLPLNDAQLIDVNHATLIELEQLPGIGPSLASNIVQFREENGFFLAPEDLLGVTGIGPAKLEQIRELITCQ